MSKSKQRQDEQEEEEDAEAVIWHRQTELLLKDWGESASSYRWMHCRAQKRFWKATMWFTLPAIVLSTIAGTISIGQSSLPSILEPYAPVTVGVMNLGTGVLTTVGNYLGVAALLEGHKMAAIAFAKLARSIRVELALPYAARSSSGAAFLGQCRAELDRLLEASPDIPLDIVKNFQKEFMSAGIHKPELLEIFPVQIYENADEKSEARVASIVAGASAELMTRRLAFKAARSTAAAAADTETAAADVKVVVVLPKEEDEEEKDDEVEVEVN